MVLSGYAFIITLVLISEHIDVSNGENLPNPDGPGGYIIPCGSVTCNVTVEYCESDVTGDSECLQCEGMCLRARVGTNERYIEECLEICPVYWQLQVDEEARRDAPSIFTSTPQPAPKWTTQPGNKNKTITGLSIGLALSIFIIIGLLIGFIVYYARVVRPKIQTLRNARGLNNDPHRESENGAIELQSLVNDSSRIGNGLSMNGHVPSQSVANIANGNDTKTTNLNIHALNDQNKDETSPKLRLSIEATVQTETETLVKVPAEASMSKTSSRSVPTQTDTLDPVGDPSPTNDDVPKGPVRQISDPENDNKDTNKFVTPAGHSIVVQSGRGNGSVHKHHTSESRTRTPKNSTGNRTVDLSNAVQHQTLPKVV